MNWLNKVAASGSPTGFAGGSKLKRKGSEKVHHHRITQMRKDLNKLEHRIDELKDIIRTEYEICTTCSDIRAYQKALNCENCNSPEFRVLGWVESLPESESLRESPAEGGAPRRGAESNNKENN